MEVTFYEYQRVDGVQIINGFGNKENWNTGFKSNYKLQYFDEKKWIDLSTFDVNNGNYNFAKDYHTYGLNFTKEELFFYFDGEEIRKVKNNFC